MKIDKPTHEYILESCMDESVKIIRYLEEEKRKSRFYNLTILIFTILGAIGGIGAAIISAILLFK